MLRGREIGIIVLIFILIGSMTIVGYGEDEISAKNLSLDSIYYDDESYLYFKIDKYMGRLSKDFTGEYKILSENEKNNIIELFEKDRRSKVAERVELVAKEIEIKDNFLYHDGLKLLNIEKYIELDNSFYEANPQYKREPLDFHISKYSIDDSKALYSISVYTSMVIPPPYTPWHQRYMLVEDGSIKELRFSRKLEHPEENYVIREVYINNDGSLWIEGYHYLHRLSSMNEIYLVDKGNKITSISKRLDEIENNKELFEIALVGTHEDSIVIAKYIKTDGEDGQAFEIDKLYDVSTSLEVKKRSEDISILKEKYPLNKNNSLYLGRDNKIYYLNGNIPGVVNLSKNAFKYFNINTEKEQYKLGDKIGTFEKSDAVVSIGRVDDNYLIYGIPVYNINNHLAICIEDLQYYGYDMEWDSKNRITKLNFNHKPITGISNHKKNKGDIIYSDIDVYVDDVKVPGYNIGGYTLVKIDDLKKLDNMIFYRRYDYENKSFSLKGKIKLPDGEVAPAGGIEGKIVVYGYGYKTKPVIVMEKAFKIPEGKEYVEYQIDNRNSTNTEELMYDDINSYEGKQVGYLIDDKYGYINGSIYNEDGRPLDGYSIYLKRVEDFKVDYDNFDIEIFKKVKLSGVVVLQDRVEYLDSKDTEREIVISAIEYEGGELLPSITKSIRVDQNTTKIVYDLDLIANKKYLMRYKVTLVGIHPNPYELSVGTPVLINNGFYNRGVFVKHGNEAEILDIREKDINNFNVEIPIPVGLRLGRVVYSDIKTYLNGEQITGININGYTAVAVNEFHGRGFEVSYNSIERRVDIIDNKAIVGNNRFDILKIEKPLKPGDNIGAILYTDIKAYINGKEVNSYNFNGYTFIMVKDLQERGFKINYNNDNRELRISSK